MRKLYSKGFTLIELLVVIAIIGILSSVTLATLNVARSKAADAAVKADLSTVRTQAGIFFDENGNYGTDTSTCGVGLFADNTIANAINHATTTSGSDAVCYADDGEATDGDSINWAVSVPLKTDPSTSWCVDSADFAGLGVAQNTATANVAECVE